MIRVFLLALLLTLWYQLTVSEGFTPLWATEDKMDYSGNDIGSSLTGVSLNECKKKCITNATCKGIVTDFSGEGTGTCWMKSLFGETGTSSDSMHTYKLTRR